MNNAFITSSDHHAHFECLDEIYKIAKEREIPFVCGGDIIGDYNFENISHLLGYRMPSEIPGLILKRDLSQEDINIYSQYQRFSQFGTTIEDVIQNISNHQQLTDVMKEQITSLFKEVQEKQIDSKVQEII